MANPNINGLELTALPFESRVQLVREAVEARIQQTPTSNPNETRARLWCNWIRKNILDREVSPC